MITRPINYPVLIPCFILGPGIIMALTETIFDTECPPLQSVGRCISRRSLPDWWPPGLWPSGTDRHSWRGPYGPPCGSDTTWSSNNRVLMGTKYCQTYFRSLPSIGPTHPAFTVPLSLLEQWSIPVYLLTWRLHLHGAGRQQQPLPECCCWKEEVELGTCSPVAVPGFGQECLWEEPLFPGSPSDHM